MIRGPVPVHPRFNLSLRSKLIIYICAANVVLSAALAMPGEVRAGIGGFESVGSLTTRRFEPAAALLPDGRVVVTGGDPHDSFDPVADIEIFDPATRKFSPGGEMLIPRSSHQVVVLNDGRVLFAEGSGGGGDNEYSKFELPSSMERGSSIGITSSVHAIEIYDPVAQESSVVGSTEGLDLGEPILLIRGGRVLFSGNAPSDWNWVDGELEETYRPGQSQVFDPTSATFTPTSPQVAVRSDGFMTTLADGRVLLAGGNEPNPEIEIKQKSAEIFDPESLSYSKTGDLVFPRVSSSATLLPNGQVLITGGQSTEAGGSTRSAELFNPETGVFSRTDDMDVARSGHDAILLGDGRVLIMGGDQPDFRSAEVYDFRTGEFSRVGSLKGGHENGAVTTLKDGSALALAGGDWNGNIGRYAEVFNPGKPAAIFGVPEVSAVTFVRKRRTVARFRVRIQNMGDLPAERVRVCVNDWRYLFRSKFEEYEGFSHCRVAKRVKPASWSTVSMALTSKKPISKERIVQMSIDGTMKGDGDRFNTEVSVKLRLPRQRG